MLESRWDKTWSISTVRLGDVGSLVHSCVLSIIDQQVLSTYDYGQGTGDTQVNQTAVGSASEQLTGIHTLGWGGCGALRGSHAELNSPGGQRSALRGGGG